MITYPPGHSMTLAMPMPCECHAKACGPGDISGDPSPALYGSKVEHQLEHQLDAAHLLFRVLAEWGKH